MPLTKAETAAIIKDLEAGGDPVVGTKFHESNVYKIAELVRNELITIEYNQTRNRGEYDINGDWITPIGDVKVEYDSSRGDYYSVIPQRYISLPNNRGLRSVTEMKNQANEFIRVATGSTFLFSGMEAENLGGNVGFYIEGDKIRYVNFRESIKKHGVLFKLIISIHDLDEDEIIPMPSSMEAAFIERVREMFAEQKVTPQDKANDNNNTR